MASSVAGTSARNGSRVTEASEIMGSHFFALLFGNRCAEWRARLGTCPSLRKEGRFEDEGWRVRKNGSRFWGERNDHHGDFKSTAWKAVRLLPKLQGFHRSAMQTHAPFEKEIAERKKRRNGRSMNRNGRYASCFCGCCILRIRSQTPGARTSPRQRRSVVGRHRA